MNRPEWAEKFSASVLWHECKVTPQFLKQNPVITALRALTILFGLIVTLFPNLHPLLKAREPRITTEANTGFEIICVCVARASAYDMYIPTIVVFISKCKALMNWVRHSFLRLWLSQVDDHSLHASMGKTILVDSMIHTACHTLRWLSQENKKLLVVHRTGITGVIGIGILFFVLVIPMTSLRAALMYEIRKRLHFFFYLFGIVLCFHVPAGVGFLSWVLCFSIIIYFLDFLWVWFHMTELIESTSFKVLKCGVQLTMPVSQMVVQRLKTGGYVYICIPWVSKVEWHPFSIYDDPCDDQRVNIFIYKTGDWSTAVHRSLTRDTTRPVFLQGPFVSPFSSALEFDKQVLVATGIGITPALCTVRALRETKVVNLVWMTHDADLVEFYLSRHDFNEDSCNLIFYTGQIDIDPSIIRRAANVRVISGFAQLDRLIPQIIMDVEKMKPVKPTNSYSLRRAFSLSKKHMELGGKIYVAPVTSSTEESQEPAAPVRGLQRGMSKRIDIQGTSGQGYVDEMSDEWRKTWGILYCGASPPVYRGVKRVAARYGLTFHVEGFKW